MGLNSDYHCVDRHKDVRPPRNEWMRSEMKIAHTHTCVFCLVVYRVFLARTLVLTNSRDNTWHATVWIAIIYTRSSSYLISSPASHYLIEDKPADKSPPHCLLPPLPPLPMQRALIRTPSPFNPSQPSTRLLSTNTRPRCTAQVDTLVSIGGGHDRIGGVWVWGEGKGLRTTWPMIWLYTY